MDLKKKRRRSLRIRHDLEVCGDNYGSVWKEPSPESCLVAELKEKRRRRSKLFNSEELAQFQGPETPVNRPTDDDVNFLRIGTPTTSLSDVEVARCPDNSLSHQENLWITPVNITEDVPNLSSRRLSGVDDKRRSSTDPLSSIFPDVYSTPVAAAYLSDSLPYSPSQPILSDIPHPPETKHLESPNSPSPDFEFFTPMSQMKSRLSPNDSQWSDKKMSKFKPKQLAAEYLDVCSEDKHEGGVGDSTNLLMKVCKSVGEKLSMLKRATSFADGRENCAFMDGHERKGESNKADLSATRSTVTGETNLKISEQPLEKYESCANGNSSNSAICQEGVALCKYKDKDRDSEKDFETADTSDMNVAPATHFSSEVDVRSARVNQDSKISGPSQVIKIKAKDVGVQKKMAKRRNCEKVAPARSAPRLKLGERRQPVKTSSDCLLTSNVNKEIAGDLKDERNESESNNEVNLPVVNDNPTESEMQKISNSSQNIEIEEKQPTCNEFETIEVNFSALVDKCVTNRKRGRPRKNSLGRQSYTPLESCSSQDMEGISPTVTDDSTECSNLQQEESVTREKSRRLRRSSFEIYKVLKGESDEKVVEDNKDSGNAVHGCNSELVPKRKRKKSNTEEDTAKIYTSKSYVPPPTKALETISESPTILKKARKFKRLIDFGSLYHIQPIKQKKRQQRAAKIGWDPRKVRKNKIPDDIVQQKLQSVWENLEKDF